MNPDWLEGKSELRLKERISSTRTHETGTVGEGSERAVKACCGIPIRCLRRRAIDRRICGWSRRSKRMQGNTKCAQEVELTGTLLQSLGGALHPTKDCSRF